ncbi:hypothetical protein [Thalassolituus marinus]|uniref:Uncharacterized protein n=1 Tax=Thalassolituus marinus TaxID=671053 RepID=A0ABS7ZSX5_9GAMM|nr:hypothetical protein [Thalassolituus marinus]MCA6064720.1 hypothetical protein [Thalassolituus marinus]
MIAHTEVNAVGVASVVVLQLIIRFENNIFVWEIADADVGLSGVQIFLQRPVALGVLPRFHGQFNKTLNL